MNKKIKYIITFAIITIVFIFLASTKVWATIDKNGAIYGYSNMLRYNGTILSVGRFSGLMSENGSFRSEFLSKKWNDIQWGGLSYDDGVDAIQYKYTICMVHQSSSTIGSVYRINTVIDVAYDSTLRKVVLKSNGQNATQSYAGELSYAIHLNDRDGWDQDYNSYKNTVDYYMWLGIRSGAINASSKFGYRSDSNDAAYKDISQENQNQLNKYASRVNNYSKMEKVQLSKDAAEKTKYDLQFNYNGEKTDYTVVGPFKLRFNSGNSIQSIAVNGDENTNDSTGRIYWMKAGSGDYGNSSKWKKNWKDIPSNEAFYLAVKTSMLPKTSTNYDIQFNQKPLEYYKARLVLLESGFVQQLGTCVATSQPVTINGSAKYTISHLANGKITIEKVFKRVENGKTVYDPIQGVQLKVYATSLDKKTAYGWLKSDGTFTNKFSNADVFKTNSSGIATFKDLKKAKYYIYEIKPANGYDLEVQRNAYEDEADPNGFAGKTEYGKCVYLKSHSSQYNLVQIKNVRQYKAKEAGLTIEKRDEETDEPIENVGFKILVKLSQDVTQGSKTYKSGSYVWLNDENGKITSSYSKAGEFFTDTSGTITFDKVNFGTYYVYEVTPALEYSLSNQTGYKKGKPSDYVSTFIDNEWVYAGKKEILSGTNKNVKLKAKNRKNEIPKTGNLKIIKKDGSYSTNMNSDLYLEGAEIKVYGVLNDNKGSGWLLQTKDANGGFNYQYTTYDKATTFTTNEQGEIDINDLEYGTYHIYETKAPNGYNLQKQSGYHENKVASDLNDNIDWVYLDYKTIGDGNDEEVAEIEVENEKYIDLKGRVWLDNKTGKLNEYDNLYGEGDQNLSGIEVSLCDRRTNDIIATTKTDYNGEYIFNEETVGKKMTYWEYAYCYVQFTYDNTKYLAVTPFKGGADKITVNSKAQEVSASEKITSDDSYTGTTGDKPGIAITFNNISNNNLTKDVIEENAKGIIKKRLLTGFYNESTETIENINLGLLEKPEPEYTIAESLKYVKMVKGNYTFTFKYGDDAVTTDNQVQSSVKFQNSAKSFTQYVYPSDIKYNLANQGSLSDNDKFKIYVVYQIEIHNDTTLNDSQLYNEEGLFLTSLQNQYDTSRYELETNFESDENSDFSKWEGSEGIAKFNISESNKKFREGQEKGLEKGDTETVDIQFKVTDSAMNEIATNKQLSTSPTIAKTDGYHKYLRWDYNWNYENENENWETYKYYEHKTINYHRESGAQYIEWRLFNTRSITGKTFEDTNVATEGSNERLGNGEYDNGEKGLRDVIVTLMDKNTGKPAYLYDEDNLQNNNINNNWSRCKVQAITKVKDDGTYEFKGVVPGKYYLKFTYGNGKVVIQDNAYELKDSNGNTIDNVSTKIEGQEIKSNNYKSTILTGTAKDAGEDWFLPSTAKATSSVAVDSMGTYYNKDGEAIQIDGQTYYDIIKARTDSDKELNYTTSQYSVVIDAISPDMNISFIYDTNDALEVKKETWNALKSECSGMNFGIIERPHTEIKLEKTIRNIKFTLSNGTNLINGNPTNQNVSKELTATDKYTAKIETDYTNLYGSTVTADYNIQAINASEKDYATYDYYRLGRKDEGIPEVTTKVTKLVDYLQYSKCNYVENSTNITNAIDNVWDNTDMANTYFATSVQDNKNYKTRVLECVDTDLKPGESINYTLSVNRLLPNTNSSEDFGWMSYSEIIGITNVTFTPQWSATSGNYKVGDSSTEEYDTSKAAITITPPTGANRSYTVYIIAISALVVVSVGVVAIKKFVLK